MAAVGVLLTLTVTGCGESQTCDFTFGGQSESLNLGGRNLKIANFLHNATGAKLFYISSTLSWNEIHNNHHFEQALGFSSNIVERNKNSYHVTSKEEPEKHMIITHYDDGEVYGYEWHKSAEHLRDNLLYKCNDLIDQYVY